MWAENQVTSSSHIPNIQKENVTFHKEINNLQNSKHFCLNLS